MSVRQALTRVIKAESDQWMTEFVYAAFAVPQALIDGRLDEQAITGYPAAYPYPAGLTTMVAEQTGLTGETAEAIGTAIRLLIGLATGDVGLADDPGPVPAWPLHVEVLDVHGLTLEQVRDYTSGLSLTDAARIMAEAYDVPLDVANQPTVARTGGFVARWLRPGDYRDSGGDVPPGKCGMQLVGGPELVDGSAELAEFGEAVAARWQSPIVTAIGELGAAIAAQFAVNNGDFAGALCCDVADAVAKTLAVSGNLDLAARFIAMHADADDDPDDRHAHIQPLPIAATIPAAEVYVRSMLPAAD